MLSPDALPMEEEDKEKLRDFIARDPLALIEYWSMIRNMMVMFFGASGRTIEEIPEMMTILTGWLRLLF